MNYVTKHWYKFLIWGSIGILSFTSCGQNGKTGTTEHQTDSVKKTVAPLQTTGHLISAWHDEAIKTDKGEQIAYELVGKDNELYIQAITFVGNDLKLDDIPPVSPSASAIKKQGDHYISVANPAESYSIDKAGNLHIYDGKQQIAICKKIL